MVLGSTPLAFWPLLRPPRGSRFPRHQPSGDCPWFSGPPPRRLLRPPRGSRVSSTSALRRLPVVLGSTPSASALRRLPVVLGFTPSASALRRRRRQSGPQGDNTPSCRRQHASRNAQRGQFQAKPMRAQCDQMNAMAAQKQRQLSGNHGSSGQSCCCQHVSIQTMCKGC